MRTFLTATVLGAAALFPLTATASAPSPTCSWVAKTDPDTVNVAFPDTNASYWSHPYAGVAGTELVVHGIYPRARYFSFHAYQPSGVPVDSIYDAQIRPDAGAANPFSGGSLTAKRQTYTLHVVFTAKPAKPAPNTVYAGRLALSDKLPNPGGLLMLRVYTPTNAASPQGGVPLPTVDLQTAGGAHLTKGTACSTDLPSTHGLGTSALNAASQPTGPSLGGQDITWGKAFGNNAAGFFGNQQNAYLTAGINRAYGNLVVIHALAPRFPDTVHGRYPSSRDQVRYWSFCQNSDSTRVNSCTADYQTAVDRKGYVTIVVSDPAQRPKNATAKNGVTWIPWGAGDLAGILIYRNMVPAVSFTHSVQAVKRGDDPRDVMGGYYPSARYCSKDAFEKHLWSGCLE